MGDAKRRLEKEAELLTFDCNAIAFSVNRVEREGLIRYPGDEKDGRPDLVNLRALELTAKGVVASALEKADRKDGKIWAAWLDTFDELSERPAPANMSCSMPRAAVDWLLKWASKDDVKTRQGLASWRESLIEYLESVSAGKAGQEKTNANANPPE